MVDSLTPYSKANNGNVNATAKRMIANDEAARRHERALGFAESIVEGFSYFERNIGHQISKYSGFASIFVCIIFKSSIAPLF
jgi:hypothetical protein